MKLEVYGGSKPDGVTRLRLNKMRHGSIDVEIVDAKGGEIETIASFEPDGTLELWGGNFKDFGFKTEPHDESEEEYIVIHYF